MTVVLEQYTIINKAASDILVDFDRSLSPITLPNNVTRSEAIGLAGFAGKVRGVKDYSKVKAPKSLEDLLMALHSETVARPNETEVTWFCRVINTATDDQRKAIQGVCLTHAPVKAGNALTVVKIDDKASAVNTAVSQVLNALNSGKAANLEVAVTLQGVVSVRGHVDGARFAGHTGGVTDTAPKLSRQAQQDGRMARLSRAVSAGKTLSASDQRFYDEHAEVYLTQLLEVRKALTA